MDDLMEPPKKKPRLEKPGNPDVVAPELIENLEEEEEPESDDLDMSLYLVSEDEATWRKKMWKKKNKKWLKEQEKNRERNKYIMVDVNRCYQIRKYLNCTKRNKKIAKYCPKLEAGGM